MNSAYLLCGPSLAGKSAVATRIAEALSTSVVSADEINAERGLPFGGEGLPESVWAETLRVQVQRFHEALARKRSVVIDDTLCYRWLRERWRQEAAKAGVKATLLLLAPSNQELLARHAALSRSGKRPVLSAERLQQHLATFELPTPDEEPVLMDTPARFESWLLQERGAS